VLLLPDGLYAASLKLPLLIAVLVIFQCKFLIAYLPNYRLIFILPHLLCTGMEEFLISDWSSPFGKFIVRRDCICVAVV